MIALPYSYRAIDAGVRSMDLHTLVEAGRTMGARWTTLFLRVLFPNLRTGILAAAFLVVALSLGEFAIASLVLPTQPTFPVWLVGVDTSSVYITVALSVSGTDRDVGAARRNLGGRLGSRPPQVRSSPPVSSARTEQGSAPIAALEPSERSDDEIREAA
jgi:hypothetical protein